MLTRRTLLAAGIAAPAILPRLARAQSDPRPVMRVAVQALSATLDPLEAINNVGLRATSNIFDTLWHRDFQAEAADGRPHLLPHLATELTQRDPLTWAVKLRPGVRMHDGSVLSAEDVLSTFSPERMYGKEVQTFEGRVNFGHLAGVEAESADTYRVASFQRDQKVVLDAHDDYWMGRPPARQVVFSVVPEGSTRLAGLMAGEFDLVTNLLPEQIEGLAGHPTLEGVDVGLDFAHILFYDTRSPALADPRVRQALNYAVDYETLGRSLWGPKFKRMAALQIPAFGDLYDANRTGFTYDPDRARRLLQQGGYRGQEIVIRIVPGYYVQMLLAVQAIQEMWAAVGVKARLETIENPAQLNQPGADVRPTSVSFRFPDPLGGGLLVHLSRDYTLQTAGFWQPTRFNEISDALKRAIEPAERKRLWLLLLDEFEAEVPALILYPVREFIAKRKAVRWAHPPLYYMGFGPDALSFA